MTTDAHLVDDNPHLMRVIAESGTAGRGIGSLSAVHREHTGLDLDAADAAAEAFVAAALRRGLIVDISRDGGARGHFVLPQHAVAPGRQRRVELDQRIATGEPRAAVDHAGFLWDAIAGAGTVGQSTLALLELLRTTWPEMSQGEAIDYLTAWIEHATDVCAIYPHQQPPSGALDWYVTPENFVRAAPRTVLVQVAQPVGLLQLAEIMTAAWKEAVRRGLPKDTLTSACLAITDQYIRVYDRPEQQ